MEMPLVSIICTTYNHEKYVQETLKTALEQTYPALELIVIDNASTDQTVQRIQEICATYPKIEFVVNSWNKGLCSAFNQGLRLAKGKYILDLSGDDPMLPERISRQVSFFESLPEEFGVIFSNAEYITTDGRSLGYHYGTDAYGKSLKSIPHGDVYQQVLEGYFICTPTMMMRRTVLVHLKGYDESLTYEDFDFWVRSSNRWLYGYQDEILTRKRIVPHSLATQVYRPGSGMLESTYRVCNKAYDINRTQEEFHALANRIRTFIRKCFYAQEFELALRFRTLLNYIEDPGLITNLIVFLCQMRLPVNRLYRLYLYLKAKKGLYGKDFRTNYVSSE
jgi:glycosyltransferase involved in cell wall biosynthesis